MMMTVEQSETEGLGQNLPHCRFVLYKTCTGIDRVRNTAVPITHAICSFTKKLCRYVSWGTRQHSWLRHYATSRKVAGSSLNEINDFFSIYLIFPAALGPGADSASNRNECQKIFLGVKGGRRVRLTTSRRHL
jgi:hypothetical protein